ncbi:MAG: hypothetical protein IJD58_07035 [Lachnospiraceae bacterium]|nr:hypothetical protein [Lachnospiraceae bacterium]
MKTKIIALVMTIVVLVGTGVFDEVRIVHAATPSQNKGFTIDENVYNVNWQETELIKVVCTSNMVLKGMCLGYAQVATGYATTKQMIDGYYYQHILVKADMMPQIIGGSLRGMSQNLVIKVNNEKNMKDTEIQPETETNSTSYTIATSKGYTGNYELRKNKEGFSFSKGGNYSFDVTSNVSYRVNSLSVSTNKYSNGFARWDYDYISSGTNAEQNKYLFGSSVQRGMFSWHMPYKNNGFYATNRVYLMASFGAGVYGGTSRYCSNSGSYTIGTNATSMIITWD